MRTKRIWMWSFIFGVTAALFAYVVMSDATVEPASTVVTAELKSAVTEEEKEEIDKNFPNPIIPVSEGKRAISLRAAMEQGVSGYIKSSSHVDIIAYESTKDEQTNKEYRTAVLILQNVKVLGTGKAADGEEEALRYEMVTVEVTPEEGVLLSLASRDKDGFYFMLRNSEDQSVKKEKVQQTREMIKEGESE
ncbi:RcpC/CpaB family pilus assembly protein [Litchfieldia salsa]|uniref:Flp pilus assembly protein CpaB n=1 Tax=Litchfieldia salsa TaxID=930152 RepID=A0A1H0UBX4_9BACI|nr:RcpC/CpaB family pilus assembly protein [Litchfieldia salsa]SDP63747.1 Flp pilus assembly protein CpaB [Litchfieldia salsa]